MGVQEFVALQVALLTPVLGGYGALFLYLRAQMEGRLQDRDKAQQEKRDLYLQIIADKDTTIARLIGERDTALDRLWEAAEVTAGATSATGTALEVTKRAVRARGA